MRIDIDIDDILNDMSSWECQQLADNLYEDGYTPKQLQVGSGSLLDGAETYLEQELSNTLMAIWSNRLHLTNSDKEILKTLSRKGSY
jgi:hypothetical protein